MTQEQIRQSIIDIKQREKEIQQELKELSFAKENLIDRLESFVSLRKKEMAEEIIARRLPAGVAKKEEATFIPVDQVTPEMWEAAGLRLEDNNNIN